MSYVKHVLNSYDLLRQLDEYFSEELGSADYLGLDVERRALNINVTLYVAKPGLVIGRRGFGIKELTDKINQRFKLDKPIYISVVDVPVPELEPRVMANRIAQQIERGVPFRRVITWALNTIMAAGALGVEIRVAGKLRTERSRFEKYRAGEIPKSGYPREVAVKSAVRHVLLKPGLYGIKVTIAYKDKLPKEFEMAPLPPVTEVSPAEGEGAKEA
ncbi:MAG: 30S ribosomal protein S3 [Nitrososphaerota archaeon]